MKEKDLILSWIVEMNVPKRQSHKPIFSDDPFPLHPHPLPEKVIKVDWKVFSTKEEAIKFIEQAPPWYSDFEIDGKPVNMRKEKINDNKLIF